MKINNNYKLILKQYGLTSNDYRQLYNSLVKDILVEIPFNINSMDRIINRLKYLNKGVKKVFKKCPRKFQFSRILRPKIENSMLTLFNVYGINSHLMCEKVWDKLKKKIDKIINYNNENKIRDYIYSKCIEFIPTFEKKLEIYSYLFWNYSEYEAYRIVKIINEVGSGKCKKYIIPMYRELEIENHEICESGKIDCVHLLTNDEYAIVDYKFGKARYYDPVWNPNFIDGSVNYDKIEIDLELGSYFNLILDIKNVYKTEVLKNGNKKLIELEYMNFKKGLILYLRDWRNTFHYIPLDDNMFIGINSIKSDIIQKINAGYFPLRPNNNCFDMCNYIDICVNDNIWKLKFSEISLDIKNKLEMIF